MMDITKYSIYEETERSKRGDHSLMIALLRSDREIPQSIREYLADELSKPPKRRFARQTRKSLDVAKADRETLMLVGHAKLVIAFGIWERAITTGDNEELRKQTGLASADIKSFKWRHISNERALDLLAEQGHEIEVNDLNNAINRRKRDKGDWDQILKQRSLLDWWL